MKRINSSEFTVKPYISKRARAAAAENSDNVVENNSGVSNSTESQKYPVSDVKTCCDFVSKCRIPLQEVSRRKEHSNAVTSIQWNERKPSCFASCSLDKSLLIWDVSYDKLRVSHKIHLHAEGLKDVKWTKNGEGLLTASFDKTSKIIDFEKGSCLQTFAHDDLVTRVCWHPHDLNVFISGTTNSGVFAWDMRQRNVIKRYKSHFGQIQDLLFLSDGKTFLTSAEVLKKNSMDQTIMAWDFDTSAVLSNQIYQEPYACTLLKHHPTHETILTQSSAGYIVILDNSSPWKMNKYKRYEGHISAGYHIGFDISVDGKYIYCGDNDGQLFVYDDYSTKILKKFQSFSSPIINVACDKTHQSRIVLSSWDGEIAVWQ